MEGGSVRRTVQAACFMNPKEVLCWPRQAVEEMAFEQYVKGCSALSRLDLFPEPHFPNCPPNTSLRIARRDFKSGGPETDCVFLLLNLPHALLQRGITAAWWGGGKGGPRRRISLKRGGCQRFRQKSLAASTFLSGVGGKIIRRDW